MALFPRNHAASSRNRSAFAADRFHRLRFEPLEDRRMLSMGTDISGNVCVTGITGSSDWISGGWDTSLLGDYSDGFFVKIISRHAADRPGRDFRVFDRPGRGVPRFGKFNPIRTGPPMEHILFRYE